MLQRKVNVRVPSLESQETHVENERDEMRFGSTKKMNETVVALFLSLQFRTFSLSLLLRLLQLSRRFSDTTSEIKCCPSEGFVGYNVVFLNAKISIVWSDGGDTSMEIRVDGYAWSWKVTLNSFVELFFSWCKQSAMFSLECSNVEFSFQKDSVNLLNIACNWSLKRVVEKKFAGTCTSSDKMLKMFNKS